MTSGARMLSSSSSGDFLRSALAVEGVLTSSAEARAWLRARSDATRGQVERIPLSNLKGWRFADYPLRLVHDSGRFFAVEGYSVRLDRTGEVDAFDQPLINQPELGVLGFLVKRFGGILHFLAQAKMEPGNVHGVQIAPTVQATESNYTRVHGGKLPPYLEYFLERGRGRILVEERQPEQAAYFLRKYNRNVVIETSEDLAVGVDFCWMTLGQLKQFLQTDYAVNMDARSVLSCVPFVDIERTALEMDTVGVAGRFDQFSRSLLASASRGARAEHSIAKLRAWLEDRRTRSAIMLTRRPLDALTGWRLDSYRLTPARGREPFSLIGVTVEAPAREIPAWSQPMVEREGVGLLGLLCQERLGTLHVLVRATVEPGCRRTVQLAPTVVWHGDWNHLTTAINLPFAGWFRDPDEAHVRFTALHSEEGGRFYRLVYRYMISEAPADIDIELPEDCVWITLDQLAQLRSQTEMSIEARNLHACLSIGSIRAG